jgi:hypothetical protein
MTPEGSFLKEGYAPTSRLGVNPVRIKASISRLGANFSRRRKNPFKKLTPGANPTTFKFTATTPAM